MEKYDLSMDKLSSTFAILIHTQIAKVASQQ